MAGIELGARIEDLHLATRSHRWLASVRAAMGDDQGRRESLVAALDIARQGDIACCEMLARCELALLPGGDAEDALTAFAGLGDKIAGEEMREARFLLWGATGDRTHLMDARRRLDECVAVVGDETRRSMLANLRVNRDIMAAWRAEFDDDEEPEAVR